MRKITALLAGAMLMTATSAMAIPTLDFGMIAPTSGSISYAGGATPLVGDAINVDNVLGMDTFLNNYTAFNIINGLLDFSTGNATSATATSANFGGGNRNYITLSGTIDLNGNGSADQGEISGVLLSGTFGTASVTTQGGIGKIAGGAFTDYKLPELLALYGLPALLPSGAPLPYDGGFNLSFQTFDTNLADGFESDRLLSGDLWNTPVPEPGTMMLLGFGLFGAAIYGKRRMNKEA